MSTANTLREQIADFQAAYIRCIDTDQLEAWPEFFVSDCLYSVTTLENHRQGLPAGLIWANSQAMLRDRVYGIKETLFHDPYYQRHVVGAPVLRQIDEQGRLHCEANYAVFRTKLDGPSTVFNVGRYLDIVANTPDGLKFAQRLCIYDSEMIPNSIIYPI